MDGKFRRNCIGTQLSIHFWPAEIPGSSKSGYTFPRSTHTLSSFHIYFSADLFIPAGAYAQRVTFVRAPILPATPGEPALAERFGKERAGFFPLAPLASSPMRRPL